MTGAVYDGDREMWMYRGLHELPVLGCEGAIIPMDAADVPANECCMPEAFGIIVVVGANGTINIVEDSWRGTSTRDTDFARIAITYEQAAGEITVKPAASKVVGTSSPRKWQFSFPGFIEPERVEVKVDHDHQDVELKASAGSFRIFIKDIVSADSAISVELGPNPRLAITDAAEHIYPILRDAHTDYNPKNRIWAAVTEKETLNKRISQLSALDMNRNLFNAIMEYVLADS